jgi:hypothetical protein
LQREAGIGSYSSAWALLHKVRLALGEGEQAHKLSRDAVEVDESKLFGRRRRGRWWDVASPLGVPGWSPPSNR